MSDANQRLGIAYVSALAPRSPPDAGEPVVDPMFLIPSPWRPWAHRFVEGAEEFREADGHWRQHRSEHLNSDPAFTAFEASDVGPMHASCVCQLLLR